MESEKEYHELFNKLTDSGRALVKGYDDYEYWTIHDSLKQFIESTLQQHDEELIKDVDKLVEDSKDNNSSFDRGYSLAMNQVKHLIKSRQLPRQSTQEEEVI